MADTHVVANRRTRVPRRALAVLAAVLLAGTTACSGSSSDSSGAKPKHKSGPEQADRRGTSDGKKAPVAAEDRAVVHTANLTIRVKDVSGAGARAKAAASDAGGYVADENTTHSDTDGSHDRSMLVLRVPVDKYDGTLDRVRRDVGRPFAQHQTSQDKTGEVADVQSRITSAKSSLRRLRKIMDQASSVNDVMDVERAISTRESDLESLQARAKALDQQTAYSTVNMRLVGPKTAVQHKKAAEPGFFDGLTGGWHALLAFLRITVLVIGAVLPFALPAAVVGVPAWWLWRRHRRTTPAPPEEPAAAK